MASFPSGSGAAPHARNPHGSRSDPGIAAQSERLEVIGAAKALSGALRFRNLYELIFSGAAAASDEKFIILGTYGRSDLNVTLKQFRRAILHLLQKFDDMNVAPGDTVCLIRLPRTSETLVAVAYAALSAAGIRVVLPMYSEVDQIGRWLVRTRAKAVFWSACEMLAGDAHDSDKALLTRLSASIDGIVQTSDLNGDLDIYRLLTSNGSVGSVRRDASSAKYRGSADANTECLVLTTSGTSGDSKLVRYRQGAIMRSCESWEIGGLFSTEKLGGRCLCLLFAHSMGIRSFWNAVWTGNPIGLIPPEWFFEHPERVRSLLLRMRPEHITGGPGVYRLLLEFGRVFPDLKADCFPQIHTVVSSGAPYDEKTAARVRQSLGIPLINAFGMTETMQVLSTLVDGPLSVGPRSDLGNPLPGVRIGLLPVGDPAAGQHKLLIDSPFGFAGYIGDEERAGKAAEAADEWFDSGDIVQKCANGLHFVARETPEFLKDSFGIKLASRLLAEFYGSPDPPIVHVEYFALEAEPGLAAMVFVEQAAAAGAGESIRSRSVRGRVRSLFEARIERLYGKADDLLARHASIARIACVSGWPPTTAKGTVSRACIEKRFAALIRKLTGTYVNDPDITEVDRERFLLAEDTRLAVPRQSELLRLIGLQQDYVSGTGDTLAYEEGGERVEVFDFVGGFGCNLLGHRHPELVEAARDCLDRPMVWLADQGSRRSHEQRLATRLAGLVSRHTGDAYVARFGSTGAEAVEMAIAHAWLEHERRIRQTIRDQKRLFGARYPAQVSRIAATLERELLENGAAIVTIERGFHGHSLAARSLLGNGKHYATFRSLTNIRKITVSPDDDDGLADRLAKWNVRLPVLRERHGNAIEDTEIFTRIVAAVVEPVRGEGGVRVVNPAVLSALSAAEFPLIFDEIQCGLGRSGSIPTARDVHGDYYLFGKALGGGFAKISALLIRRDRYVDTFDEHYLSTFAGDAFSCAMAERVLTIVDRDNVSRLACERGKAIRRKLARLQQSYPLAIKAIHGRGLLLGVELAADAVCGQALFRAAVQHDTLGLLVAAYLLQHHRVRILPTLSAPNEFRIEPGVYVTDAAIERLVTGLEDVCNRLQSGDGAALIRCLVKDEVEPAAAAPECKRRIRFDSTIAKPADGAVKVALLTQVVDPERDLAMLDPTLDRLDAGARRALMNKLQRLLQLKSSTLFARNIFADRVWFSAVAILADTATVETMTKGHGHALVVDRIQQTLDRCAATGCKVVGLGAHTSIATNDGTALLVPEGVRLTTGNTLTVAVAAHRIVSACRLQRIGPEDEHTMLAILGATGNIGRALAHQLVCHRGNFRRIVLIARDRDRLGLLRNELVKSFFLLRPARSPLPDIQIATDVAELRSCNVIAAAVGTNEPLIDTQHIDRDRRVLVADVSVPGVVTAGARALRHVRIVSLFGTVRMPDDPEFVMASHLGPGTALSCAAEVMLLGLEPAATADMRLIGPVDHANVAGLDRLARCHGFYARFDRQQQARHP